MDDTCKPMAITGGVTWVDTSDYESVSQYNWYVSSGGYVARNIDPVHSARTIIMLHTQITGRKYVDHRDGNKLDNRRCNLRPATYSQNGANRGKQTGVYTSRFKGVCWNINASMWSAQITVWKHKTHLGYFVSEVDAAKAYDEAAIIAWGEFAKTNVYYEEKQS